MREVAFVACLGDLYELKGDSVKAKEVRNDVVGLLEEGQKNQDKEAVKHNANREMAIAYLNVHNMDKALRYANTDLAMRPDNIDANELVAWIYYLKGDYTNAKVYADKMLKTNVKNTVTLYKAAVIYTAAGDKAKGDEMMQACAAISPYTDQKIVNQVKHL
jgi:Tfp pilus assembly protein PilF